MSFFCNQLKFYITSAKKKDQFRVLYLDCNTESSMPSINYIMHFVKVQENNITSKIIPVCSKLG
jgi:hypothetical protein